MIEFASFHEKKSYEYKKYKDLSIKGKQSIKRIRRAKKNLKRCLAIVQEVASVTQNEIHKKLSGLVQKCIDSVFGKNKYTFQIRFESKRNNSEAKIIFKKKGIELESDSIGGGVIDVVSFALRLSCLSMMRPQPRKILILDEPFKFLSKRNDYKLKIKFLLETLVKELNFQIIMVTHDHDLEIGQIHNITD